MSSDKFGRGDADTTSNIVLANNVHGDPTNKHYADTTVFLSSNEGNLQKTSAKNTSRCRTFVAGKYRRVPSILKKTILFVMFLHVCSCMQLCLDRGHWFPSMIERIIFEQL